MIFTSRSPLFLEMRLNDFVVGPAGPTMEDFALQFFSFIVCSTLRNCASSRHKFVTRSADASFGMHGTSSNRRYRGKVETDNHQRAKGRATTIRPAPARGSRSNKESFD